MNGHFNSLNCISSLYFSSRGGSLIVLFNILLTFSYSGLPFVSGSRLYVKIQARIVKVPKIRKAAILPGFVDRIDRNVALTAKLLNQLVAVAREVAVPIKWIG